MKLVDGSLRLSPTDLANYAACPHLTTLDLRAARGEVEAPYATSPVTEALRRRGEAHESAYIEQLRRNDGLEICDLRGQPLDTTGAGATAAAMATGVSIIVQAPLLEPGWAGRADVLRRVESASRLGAWSYEPLDTKLARETRGSAILQLCAYASALENVQGRLPESVHVVAPGRPFDTRTYRLAEYAAYYRLLRGRLEARCPGDAPADTYPESVAHCDICRWSARCDAHRRKDDHLSLVASIRRLQVDQFRAWEIGTLAQLGAAVVPFAERPTRGSAESLVRAREQARVQLAGRTRGRPVHELLPIVAGTGLLRLPRPSAGDIFFDLEGDPFAGEAGREYLFGYACQDDRGDLTYDHRWGLTAAAEREAFETFVDLVLRRWEQDPDLHVYHYAPYEPSALKRLMGRFGVREDAIDRMLRAELFVDLYAVVRQGLRASVERYSIKTLEPFYGYVREMPLADATRHLQAMDLALEFNEADAVPADTLDVVRRYNKDDCVSAARLRDWLEKLRAEAIASGQDLPRPVAVPAAPNQELEAREAHVRALMDRLTAGVPAEPLERSHEQHARWLLAQLLEFHRREDKSAWWDYYRLCDLPPEDYLDEPCAIDGLTLIGSVGGTARCPIHRYSFPAQELKPSKSEVHYGKDLKLGGVEAFDLEALTIDVRKTTASRDVHPTRVFFLDRIPLKPLPETLFDIATWVAAHHVEGDGPYRAGRDLLLTRPPRLRPGARWHVAGESATDRARRLVLALDDTVLAVQGPPGSGKTFIGAQMVCALVRAGKRVGVTATSHKVIRNLLDAIERQAARESLDVACIHKISGDASAEPGAIVETDGNETVRIALDRRQRHVAGGTAWLWAREDMEAAVDVLVVDEAGQMSLANVVACSRGARNVVLLGDPQQLEQPLKGSHPDGSAVSALQHILGSARTMPDDRGLFLPETRRLSPAICRFTSELFYDNRLGPLAGLDGQRLVGPPPFAGSGLWYVPVTHTGNQNLSTEEAAVVSDICDRLVQGYEWIDDEGRQSRLNWADILVVAPYNSQVYEIQGRLPEARVGTVDRFQGQEAAVVIYSATTSAPEDAPRGMEFLYSLNRLNVATSRARCAVILVASPLLFEPDCQTPRQMQLVNAFCRYAELAVLVDGRSN